MHRLAVALLPQCYRYRTLHKLLTFEIRGNGYARQSDSEHGAVAAAVLARNPSSRQTSILSTKRLAWCICVGQIDTLSLGAPGDQPMGPEHQSQLMVAGLSSFSAHHRSNEAQFPPNIPDRLGGGEAIGTERCSFLYRISGSE